MKKILLILLMIMTAIGSLPAWADQRTWTVPVQAQVPPLFQLDLWIRSCPSDSTPYGSGSSDTTDMSFGTLAMKDKINIFLPDKYFTVFLVATTSGQGYQMLQNCTKFSSDAFNYALLMTPDFKQEDLFVPSDPTSTQDPLGSGDRLGPKALAVGNSQMIFSSTGISGPRIIRCYYGVATGDPTANEPSGAKVLTGKTPAGNYSSVVTFTLVPN